MVAPKLREMWTCLTWLMPSLSLIKSLVTTFSSSNEYGCSGSFISLMWCRKVKECKIIRTVQGAEGEIRKWMISSSVNGNWKRISKISCWSIGSSAFSSVVCAYWMRLSFLASDRAYPCTKIHDRLEVHAVSCNWIYVNLISQPQGINTTCFEI